MPPHPAWPGAASLPALGLAPLLVGADGWSAVIQHAGVAVRLTEVEAYGGAEDPGSHAHRGTTARSRTMAGPAGTLYCYRIYGLHVCANLVCLPEGEPAAVLLRAGAVVAGLDVARGRRPGVPTERLARGPANLVRSLALTMAHDGALLGGADAEGKGPTLTWVRTPGLEVLAGARVGVAGEGGDADRFPWRFRVADDPTVSAYRAAVRRGRGGRA